MTWEIKVGDVRAVLPTLPDESVHCVVTSPPYWGLRDYGTAAWEGGDVACEHRSPTMREGRNEERATLGDGIPATNSAQLRLAARTGCGKCGARRIDSQLGLEPTPEEYVATMVEVFREVRRVLRKDGTAWINLGDSYAGAKVGNTNGGESSGLRNDGRDEASRRISNQRQRDDMAHMTFVKPLAPGLKPKDLCGIPWRLAFALQADGWVLRSDVVWQKPNPMPESVTDRPTKSHEMVFLMSKARWVGPGKGQFGGISDEDARWLALLFDTEGNIVIKRSQRADGHIQYGAQMAFANTSLRLLETARGIVGKGSLHERPGKNAPVYYWQMTGREARDLLYRIAPFLIVKQRQARVAIHMQSVMATPGKKRPGRYRTPEHGAFLDKCWRTVKALNRFGDPDLSWVPDLKYGNWVPERYFYDGEAVRETAGANTHSCGNGSSPKNESADVATNRANANWRKATTIVTARNLRSVWTIATHAFPLAHFATFPPKLAERCIKAGTSERGCCAECGAPWERVVERGELGASTSGNYHPAPNKGNTTDLMNRSAGMTARGFVPNRNQTAETIGWRPTCSHDAEPVPCTVLDPFAGAGTTGLVATRLSRSFVGIELNPKYAAMARHRIFSDAPLFSGEPQTPEDAKQMAVDNQLGLGIEGEEEGVANA